MVRESLLDELEELLQKLPISWISLYDYFEFANVWVYGENIYFACRVENQTDAAPALFRINPQGKVEVLATKGDIRGLSLQENYYFQEIVAVLELPNNEVIFSTHPTPELVKRDVEGNLAVKANLWTSEYGYVETVYSMCMDDQGNLYAVTYKSTEGRILKSTDKGETWSQIYGPIAGGQFFDVEFRKKRLGTTLLVASSNGIYRSTNRGSSFTQVLSSSVGIRDIEYIGHDVWIAYPDGRTYFFISFDDGETWEQAANNTGVEKEWSINSFKADALGRLWVVGQRALAYSKDGGSTWVAVDFSRYLTRDFRGIGLTSTHLYIGSELLSGDAFFGAEKIGHILIVPIHELPEVSNYPPQILWSSEAIASATPEETNPILIGGVKEKTVYIKSTQAGTARIMMYNEISKSYEEIDNFAVNANTLTKYSFTYVGRAFKLRFEPSADATVDAWVALR